MDLDVLTLVDTRLSKKEAEARKDELRLHLGHGITVLVTTPSTTPSKKRSAVGGILTIVGARWGVG